MWDELTDVDDKSTKNDGVYQSPVNKSMEL